MTNRIKYPRHLSIPLFCLIIIFTIYLCNIFSYYDSTAATHSSVFETKGITISPQDPKIRYTGRIDFSNPKRPSFTYPGVSIKAKFKGTSITVMMEDSKNGIDGYQEAENNYFTVIVDDTSFSVLKMNNDEINYTLAKGLKDAPHTIEIIKRTESMVGRAHFLGFKIQGDKELLDLPARTDRRIEFIGNSITCGYGNEGEKPQEKFRASTENNYMAYGPITARKVKAEYMEVCFSGKGVFRNFGGGRDNTLTDFYEKICPDDEDTKWDFKKFSPHAVVVNTGTNDFYMGNIPDSAGFVNAYQNFISTVRAKYPEAKIFCVLGPLMSGTSWTLIRRYVSDIVERLSKKGDKELYYFTLTPCSGGGSDYHPSVAQHIKMAEEFTPFLKEKMKW